MNPIVILGSIWPTTVEGWVNLVVFIAGFVAAVAVLIPTVIKLVKKGAELVKHKNWSKMKDIALAAMKEAEASGKKGSEKQQMVIDAVVAGCKEALFDEANYFTEENIDFIKRKTNTQNAAAWALLKQNFFAIDAVLSKAKRTLTLCAHLIALMN